MREELRLWSVGESGDIEPLPPVQEMPTELALEDLLVGHPEMLEPGLKLVGRQTPTETGWLDLLGVDRDGRLVVYELKRGTLTRDAVTQVLDYASDLDSMSIPDLTKHIAERSGNDGIQEIDDFEEWYADNLGGDDLSRLLPPRMVLIGLGMDPVLERMARFISGGPVDLSVVTFQGFMHGEDRLLARQVEVEPQESPSGYRRRSVPVSEKREALREHLTHNGYADVFDRVHDDLLQSFPERGVWEEPGATGIRFQLKDVDNPKNWKSIIGVQAGYLDPPEVYSVSILPEAIRWGEDALEELRKSVHLDEWSHGGECFTFATGGEWAKIRPAMLKFVEVVMANRAVAEAKGREPDSATQSGGEGGTI